VPGKTRGVPREDLVGKKESQRGIASIGHEEGNFDRGESKPRVERERGSVASVFFIAAGTQIRAGESGSLS